MARLQQQTIMPFIITQHEHMLPASMVQRFWTMLHAGLSSQLHMIFMPPVHFSILTVQRGTIIMLGAMAGAPMAGVFIAGDPMFAIPEFLSIIIALVMSRLLPSCVHFYSSRMRARACVSEVMCTKFQADCATRSSRKLGPTSQLCQMRTRMITGSVMICERNWGPEAST
jgi:hypothetical protein